jgi:hypothetical protein
MAGRLPLLAEILRRKGKARENQTGQVPIVYGKWVLGSSGAEMAGAASAAQHAPAALPHSVRTTEKFVRITEQGAPEATVSRELPPPAETRSPGGLNITVRFEEAPPDSASLKWRALREDRDSESHPAATQSAPVLEPALGQRPAKTNLHSAPLAETAVAEHERRRVAPEPELTVQTRTQEAKSHSPSPSQSMETHTEDVRSQSHSLVVKAQHSAFAAPSPEPPVAAMPIARPKPRTQSAHTTGVNSSLSALHVVAGRLPQRNFAVSGQTGTPQDGKLEPTPVGAVVEQSPMFKKAKLVVRAGPVSPSLPMATSPSILDADPALRAKSENPSPTVTARLPLVHPQQSATPFGSLVEPSIGQSPSADNARRSPRVDLPPETGRPLAAVMPHDPAGRPPIIERVAANGARNPEAPGVSPGSPAGTGPAGNAQVASIPAAGATAPASTGRRTGTTASSSTSQPEIDVESLVDQVQRKLLRRLAAERDRKGMTR